MKTFKSICLLVLMVILFTACSPGTATIPTAALENNPSATSMPVVGMQNDPSATPIPVVTAQNDPKATMTAPVLQVDNPYAPQAGDVTMLRGELTVDSASLSITKDTPPQVRLNLAYLELTPCYKLRMDVSQPDAQDRINITAYVVTEKGKPCALMALATDLQASLNLGSFPKGHYNVWLNDAKVGEFDS